LISESWEYQNTIIFTCKNGFVRLRTLDNTKAGHIDAFELETGCAAYLPGGKN
jgi:hypothetical protein